MSNNSSAKSWRNKAYHAFFEDYIEREVEKPGGKGTKIIRIYAGDYYHAPLTKKKRILYRVIYAALFLGAAVSFVCGCTVCSRAAAGTWYLTAVQAAFAGFTLWMLYLLINYCMTLQDFTVYEYKKYSCNLPLAAGGNALCCALNLILSAVHMLLSKGEWKWIALTVLWNLLGMAAFWGIYALESGLEYQKLPSEGKNETGYPIY